MHYSRAHQEVLHRLSRHSDSDISVLRSCYRVDLVHWADKHFDWIINEFVSENSTYDFVQS